MGKRLLASLLLIFIAASLHAQTAPLTREQAFNKSHQVGARIGVWGNLGDRPPVRDSSASYQFETDVKGGSFYAEGYAAFRIWRPLMFEISLGIVNRGDVTIDDLDFGYSYIGNLILYPMQARLKLYPLARSNSSIQPYLMAGGGIIHGRNNIQFSNDYYAEFNEQSATTVNFTLGGGLDFPISHQIGLDLNANYLPIHFSKELFAIKNYSALTVTVGVKYLYTSKKKDSGAPRRN
ncbi:MAG: outer membrane beta-barrel protein [Candidatus Zixiibacteriota bacterium]